MPLFRERRPQQMLLASGEMTVVVRESRKARRMTLRVKPGDDGRPRVSLSVPPRTTEQDILGMLELHQGWVERTVADQQASVSKLGLRRPGHVPFEGRLLRIVRARHDGRAHVKHGRTPGGEPVLGLYGPHDKLPAALDRWLRDAVRRRAREIIDAAPPELRRRVTKIRVGDQKTRWGSMTANGVISLNRRLILAPPEVLDYVVRHELCHLLEMNHSPRFWAHVTRLCPNWRIQRAWLTTPANEIKEWAP